jgi:hypothetical protein
MALAGTEQEESSAPQASDAKSYPCMHCFDAPAHLAQVPWLLESIGYEALDRQYQALIGMPSVKVEYTRTGVPRMIVGSTGIYLPASTFEVDQSAPAVLEKFGSALLARGTEELRVRNVSDPVTRGTDLDGKSRGPSRTIRLDEYVRGFPVLGVTVNLAVSEGDDEVTTLVSHGFAPDRGLPSKPKLSASKAIEALVAGLRAEANGKAIQVAVSDSEPTLAYAFEYQRTAVSVEFGPTELVWVIHVGVARDDLRLPEGLRALVSATTGKVLRLEPLSVH